MAPRAGAPTGLKSLVVDAMVKHSRHRMYNINPLPHPHQEKPLCPAKPNPNPRTLSLSDALNILTLDDLRPRVSLLKDAAEPKRKADFIAVLEKHLEGERLQALWARLDDLQQKAVQEAIYAPEGVFDRAQFQAKYGELPSFGTPVQRSWGSSSPQAVAAAVVYL